MTRLKSALYRLTAALLLASWLGTLTGCALVPPGTGDEQARLQSAGEAYRVPPEKRVLPELSAEPSWQEVLRRAFLANGDLEAAYHEWAAAVHRIDKDAAWPNANLEIGFDYMFSPESMKSWNRTTLSAGFVNDGLTQPFKARQAGKAALTEARAAGERFLAAKFALQAKVLQGWTDYALAAERVRIQQENVDLLRLMVETARGRVRAGGPQQDLLSADVELERAEDELKSLQSEIPRLQAMINTMLGRDPRAPLAPPKSIPGPRAVAADDAQLLTVAAEANPELAALAAAVQAREESVELARLMYIPDISPTAAFTGDISQVIGAMVMVPTNIPAIRAEVRQMRSMAAAAEAALRQARLDRGGQFVAALAALRNFDRQAALFRTRIIPASTQVMDLTRQSYATGAVGFAELVDSHHLLLEAKLVLAEARGGREKQLAELEALAGVDIETVGTLAPDNHHHRRDSEKLP